MAAYYNEFDPKAAAWLRELIKAGMIAPGDVDERSIIDVQPNDLAGYTQCHFFAGVGGWSIAARLAGWPDDRELWTGSCPCQPFSVAGKGAGAADARHLWPDFFRLIRSCRPTVVMGEQVAAAVGKDWLDGVFDDLEGIGYACEAAIAPACAVNAPHRRDRLWFVAGSRVLGDCDRQGLEERERITGVRRGAYGALTWQDAAHPGSLDCINVANAMRSEWRPQPQGWDVDHRHDAGRDQAPSGFAGGMPAGADCGLANADSSGRSPGLDHATAGHGDSIAAAGRPGAWDSARWLIGHDGKVRRVEPSVPLLVDGLPNRASLLRGYGNAIVPALAAEVIGAWMDCNP